jgi:hypothetical protein
MCKICFQCMILVCEMYKLWMNEFYTISITKSGNVKFVMLAQIYQSNPNFFLF